MLTLIGCQGPVTETLLNLIKYVSVSLMVYEN
ncbi:hypothetical protein STW0522RAO56_13820 [Raoultella planticola]|nr:hypothetical protein STW0522RAO56_13820 [Raoultella planticola]